LTNTINECSRIKQDGSFIGKDQLLFMYNHLFSEIETGDLTLQQLKEFLSRLKGKDVKYPYNAVCKFF
jgi:hypothetical protein